MRHADWLPIVGLCLLLATACGAHVVVPQEEPTAGGSGSVSVALAGSAGLSEVGLTEGGSAPQGIDVQLARPSAGCNRPLPEGQLLRQYIEHTTHVTGRTLDPNFSVAAHDRNYFVWLPADYDNSKPHRVTFLFMGCGDRSAADLSTYRLMSADRESIYVAMNMAPPGFPPEGRDCYDDKVGRQSIEWEFMGLTASSVQNDFCIDENRLFVVGYSSGAWVANMLGCYFAGEDPSRLFGKDISVRGQVSVSGGPVQPDVPCGTKVAALWLHDTDDKEAPISVNEAVSLPRVLAANGCLDGTAGPRDSWDGGEGLTRYCQQFTGCPAAYPVIFCATSGMGHSAEDNLAIPGAILFENWMNAR